MENNTTVNNKGSTAEASSERIKSARAADQPSNSPIAKKVVIENLQKATKQAVIVEEINITVHEGEIYALVGPDGSGKTLVAKMMLNLVHKTAGTVTIDKTRLGSVIGDMQHYDAKTGYQTLKAHATVSLKTISRARIVNVLNLMGLKKIMHTTVSRYNASQQQRLKIACAILARPAVLILDEPFRGLTSEEARAVRVILRSLADNVNTAILITAENLEGVEEICDTVGIIEDGMLLLKRSYNEMRKANENTAKISVRTELPHYTAELIEKNLGYTTALCGAFVIVDTQPTNSDLVADVLTDNGVRILGMQKVFRPLSELYYDFLRQRRGEPLT